MSSMILLLKVIGGLQTDIFVNRGPTLVFDHIQSELEKLCQNAADNGDPKVRISILSIIV